MAGWIYGIKVTPIGDGGLEAAATLDDGRYRLATLAPSWDTSSVYREVLRDVPDEIGHRVDWQSGSCTIGGLDLDLLPTTEVLGWFCRPIHERLTELSSTLAIGAANPFLDATGLDGETVVIGREAIYLNGETGAGPYEYASSTRGVLGTIAAPHGTEFEADIEVFDAEASPLRDLPVEFFRVPMGGTYTDEEALWTGILRRVEWDASSGWVRLSCDSALDVLERTTICNRLWRAKDQSPGTNNYLGAANRAPAGNTGVSPIPVLLSDGDRAWRGYAFWTDGGRASTSIGPATVSFGYERWGGGAALHPLEERDGRVVLTDMPAEMWQIFSTRVEAPAVNTVGDTLSRNAITLALQLMTTTLAGANGSYDLGDSAAEEAVQRAIADLGAGIPVSLLDLDEIEATRDRLGGEIEIDLDFPFDGKPIKLMGFIREKLLRPFGLALVPGSGAKLTIRGLRDGAVDGTAVTQDDLVTGTLPVVRWSGVPSVDEVVVSYNDRPGIGPDIDTFVGAYLRERSVAGTSLRLEIDASGVRDTFRAEGIGIAYASRYAIPVTEIDIVTTRLIDLVIGDVVKLTHTVIPGRLGAKGITAETMIVSAREVELATGYYRYTLWWTGAGLVTPGRIGPAARVVSWSNPTLTVEANAFVPSGHSVSLGGVTATTDAGVWEGLYALDSALSVLILDSDLSQRGTATLFATAGSGAANTVALTGASVTPAAGDVIVLASYDSTVSANTQDRYAYLADGNDTLGAGGDAANQWSA